MPIHSDTALTPDVLPGLAHRTLAGAEHGLERLAVWSQRIAPAGATPPHSHDCEEVILVQGGGGTLVFDGEEQSFSAGDTIIVPPSAVHQILNTGDEDLVLLAVLSTSRVAAELPDGTPIDLPWD